MFNKVAVMAGTPVDTKMGADILDEKKFEISLCPISKSCDEQNDLQILSKKELSHLVEDEIKVLKEKKIEKLLVYCNSLSSIVDFNLFSKKYDIKIVTPYDAYKKIAKEIKSAIILAANSISTANIEEFIKSENKDVDFLTVGNLNLVYLIENEKDKEMIIKKAAIEEFINFCENIKMRYDDKSLLLSCTHFPYIKEEIKKFTKTIKIIDPAMYMLKELER